uniref:ubiquitinyl hydrolase 1 n=1 Tax=Panagrolaimus davidi TaxID=227884 RepID=A0A914PD41_9BILA
MQQSMFNVDSMTDAANTIAINLAGAENEPLYEHFDDQGNYSLEVLELALEPHGCHLEQLNKPKYLDRYDNPQLSQAYLLNPGNHWFSIRRFNDIWILFDSQRDGARRIDNIQKYFRRMKEHGTTIYVVTGNLPDANVSETELLQLKVAKLPEQLSRQSKKPIPDSKKNVANIEQRYIRISDSDSDDYVKPSSFKKQTPSKTSNAETPTESTTKQRPRRPRIPLQNSSDSITIDSDSDSNVKKGSAEKSKTGKTRSTTKKQPEPTKPTKKNYQNAKPKITSQKEPDEELIQEELNEEELNEEELNEEESIEEELNEEELNEEELNEEELNEEELTTDTTEEIFTQIIQTNPEIEKINQRKPRITKEELFEMMENDCSKKDFTPSISYFITFKNRTNNLQKMIEDISYYGFTDRTLKIRWGEHQTWEEGPLAKLSPEERENAIIVPIYEGHASTNKIIEAVLIILEDDMINVLKNVKKEPINCKPVENLINLYSKQRKNVVQILTTMIRESLEKKFPNADKTIMTDDKFKMFLQTFDNNFTTAAEKLLEALQFEHPWKEGQRPGHTYGVFKIFGDHSDISQTLLLYIGKTVNQLRVRRRQHTHDHKSAIYDDLNNNNNEIHFIQLIWINTNENKIEDFEAILLWVLFKTDLKKDFHLKNRVLERIKSKYFKRILLNNNNEFSSNLQTIKQGVVETFTNAIRRFHQTPLDYNDLEYVWAYCRNGCGARFASNRDEETHATVWCPSLTAEQREAAKKYSCRNGCGARFVIIQTEERHDVQWFTVFVKTEKIRSMEPELAGIERIKLANCDNNEKLADT